MKTHTTNYINTFIEVAEDCPAASGEIPPQKRTTRTIANIQFDLLNRNPYKLTSDDVVFQTYAEKNDIPKSEWKKARETFFSKGQPCMRCSPLTKRYGWGVHNDKDGKLALVANGSAEYKKLVKDKTLKTVKAMRSSK